MFKTKLGFRIALVVIISIMVIELASAVFTVSKQRQNLLDKRLENLQFSVGLLEGVISSDLFHSRLQEAAKILSDLATGFSAYSYTLCDPKGKVLAQQVFKDGYQAHGDDLKIRLPMVEAEKIPPSQVLHGTEGDVLRYLMPIHNESGELVGGLELETPTQAIDTSVRQFLWKTVGTTLVISLGVSLLVTALVTFVLLHFVVRPINILKEEMEMLSKGEADLTFQAQIKSNDEIGQMATWFNSFIGRVRAMVLRIREHSQHLQEQVQTMTHSTSEVSAMSEDVTTTVQQIARGAEEQASKIAEVNQLIQEMQDGMRDMEKKSKETFGAVDKATQTAKVGGKLAKNTIDKMSEINETILKNSKMVSKLGVKSQQVGRAVEIINGIAEQTNLLSLNAAIEAARAGEQGRGFAVVSEEIRSLADGASKAAQEISQLVQEMQDETQAVVESMEKSSGEAQGGKDSIHQMENTLGDIIMVVEGVVIHSKGIMELISAQAQRYTKVAHSIQDINAVSEESAASTEEVSAATQEQSASMEQVNATCKELAAMAEELRTMVEKFKIK
ncbi:MAG TPA: methyl-accepting chemotaxis protein [bacterium]|nr:methyl-accepting chemotaxis protein [bacterium]